jgi:hypothetical protein
MRLQCGVHAVTLPQLDKLVCLGEGGQEAEVTRDKSEVGPCA